MKYALITLFVTIVAFVGWLYLRGDSAPQDRTDSNVGTVEQQPEETFDKTRHSIDEPDSIWLIVNKQRPIPENYAPENLRDVDVPRFPGKPLSELKLRNIAAGALEDMFAAAEAEDVELIIGSGYRSYDVQEFYYSNYVATYGQEEADKFSARPGTSEHQTGLAADVSGVSRACYLEICFEDTPAGKWVAENAAEFGFIIRYPKNKTALTGYQYEPWHLRYVGVELAQELTATNQVMETFFSL